MKKLFLLIPLLALCLVLPVSAFDFINESGTFKNLTVTEYKGLFNDFTGGAIVMKEGQRGATLDFEPDNNDEDSLGRFGKAFKNTYVSSTLYVGNNTEGTTTSTFTKLAVGDNNGDFTVNGKLPCLEDGANCALATTNALWTTATTYLYYNSSTAVTAGLGETTPDALWDINGMADITQLIVEGHSTQNADLIQGSANGGNVIFSVDVSGNVSASGTLAVVGASTLTGATTITGALTTGGGVISDANNTDSLGSVTVAWADIYASGTVYADTLKVGLNTGLGGTLTVVGASTLTGAVATGGGVNSDTTNTDDLGTSAIAWKDIYTSGTIYVDSMAAHGGTLTIGEKIVSDTTNTDDLGTSAIAWKDIYTSGTVYMDAVASHGGTLTIGESITSDTTNTDDFGTFALAWKDIYASGTVYGDFGTFEQSLDVGGGVNASTTLRAGASATSTFSSSVILNEGATATSTLQLGAQGVAGYGSCIVMASGGGSGNLYLFVQETTLQLVTSTNASDCY